MLVLTLHYVDILNSGLQFLKSLSEVKTDSELITMETEYWLLDYADQEVTLISLASTAWVSKVVTIPDSPQEPFNFT